MHPCTALHPSLPFTHPLHIPTPMPFFAPGILLPQTMMEFNGSYQRRKVPEVTKESQEVGHLCPPPHSPIRVEDPPPEMASRYAPEVPTGLVTQR